MYWLATTPASVKGSCGALKLKSSVSCCLFRTLSKSWVAVDALCSEILSPISSSILFTLNLNKKLIIKKIVNAEIKQKPPTLTIPISWIYNWSIIGLSIPIASKSPNSATAIVAQVPANKWTGTALTTSSTFIFSNNKIPDPDTIPPIAPIIIASVGST